MLLGTRMWYAFFDCEAEPDTLFDSRLEPLVREIGDQCRGRAADDTPAPAARLAAMAEGVPPASTTVVRRQYAGGQQGPPVSAASVPAPSTATVQLPETPLAVAAALEQNRSFSPTMLHMSPATEQQQQQQQVRLCRYTR